MSLSQQLMRPAVDGPNPGAPIPDRDFWAKADQNALGVSGARHFHGDRLLANKAFTPGSVGVWLDFCIYPTFWGVLDYVIDCGATSSSDAGIRATHLNGHPYCSIGDGTQTKSIYGGTLYGTNEEWYHLLYIADFTEGLAYLYINGVQDATPVDISDLTYANITHDKVYIGARGHDTDTSWIKGYLQNVRLAKGFVPTATQRLELYNEGNGKRLDELSFADDIKTNGGAAWNMSETDYDATAVDACANGYDAVVDNVNVIENENFEDVDLQNDTLPNSSFENGTHGKRTFNGDFACFDLDSYVQLGTNNWVIEWWQNSSDLDDTAPFSFGAPGATYPGVWCRTFSDGRLRIHVNDATTTIEETTATGVLQTGVEQHICLIKTTNNLYVYVNNANVKTIDVSSITGSMTSAQRKYVGAQAVGNRQFVGTLRGLRVYLNDAFSTAELNEAYNGGTFIKGSQLSFASRIDHNWEMNDHGEGEGITDYAGGNNGTLISTGIQLNGDFESYTGTQDDGTTDNITAWNVTERDGTVEATATVNSGTNAIKFGQATGSTALMRQGPVEGLNLKANRRYKVTYYTRGDGGTAQVNYRVYHTSGDSVSITGSGITGTTYTQDSFEFDCLYDDSELYFYGSVDGDTYVDDVTVEAIDIQTTADSFDSYSEYQQGGEIQISGGPIGQTLPDGDACLRIDDAASTPYIVTNAAVTGGQLHRLTVNTSATTNGALQWRLYIKDGASAGWFADWARFTNESATWTEEYVEFIIPVDCTNVDLYLSGDGDKTVYVDDISLQMVDIADWEQTETPSSYIRLNNTEQDSGSYCAELVFDSSGNTAQIGRGDLVTGKYYDYGYRLKVSDDTNTPGIRSDVSTTKVVYPGTAYASYDYTDELSDNGYLRINQFVNCESISAFVDNVYAKSTGPGPVAGVRQSRAVSIGTNESHATLRDHPDPTTPWSNIIPHGAYANVVRDSYGSDLTAREFWATEKTSFSYPNPVAVGTGSFSIEWWHYFGDLSASTWHGIFSHGSGSEADAGVRFLVLNDGRALAYLSTGSGTNETDWLCAAGTFQSATWQHCVLNVDRVNNLATLYVNSVVQLSNDIASIGTGSMTSEGQTAWQVIGAAYAADSASAYYSDLRLSRKRIRSRVLSQGEVSQAFGGGWGRNWDDLSPNEKDGLLANWELDETSGDAIDKIASNDGTETVYNFADNGTFTAPVTEWSIDDAAWTFPGTVARCAATVGTPTIRQNDLVGPRAYDVTFDVASYTAGQVRAIIGSGIGTWRSSTGTFNEQITNSSSANATIYLQGDSSADLDVDNFEIKATGIGYSTGVPTGRSNGTMIGFDDYDEARSDETPDGTWGQHVKDEGRDGVDGVIRSNIKDSRSSDVPRGTYFASFFDSGDNNGYKHPRLVDSSGNGHHVELDFAVQTGMDAVGLFEEDCPSVLTGQCLSFNNVDDASQIGNIDLTSIGTLSKLAISFWLKEKGADATDYILHCNYGGTNGGFQIRRRTSNRWDFTLTSQASGYTWGIYEETHDPGAGWHHFLCTWDGTTTRLFIDGSWVASDSRASEAYTWTGGLNIGEYSIYPTDGKLKDIRLYVNDEVPVGFDDNETMATTLNAGNDPTNDPEVHWTCDASWPAWDAKIDLDKLNDGSIARSDDIPTALVGKGVKSMLFNDESITLGDRNFSGLSGRAFSFWIKTSSTTSDRIYGECAWDSNKTGAFIATRGDVDGRFEFNCNPTTNGAYGSTEGHDICDGVWHHCVGTWDGTTDADSFKLYVDNVVKDTATPTSDWQGDHSQYDFAQLGNSNASDVLICDFRIYRGRGLSAAEVASLFTGGEANTTPTVRLSGNEETTNVLDVDYSIIGNHAKYVECNVAPTAAQVSGGATLEGFVKFTNADSTAEGFGCNDAGMTCRAYVGKYSSSVYFGAGNVYDDSELAANWLESGRWHHMGIVLGANGEARGYVDGILAVVFDYVWTGDSATELRALDLEGRAWYIEGLQASMRWHTTELSHNEMRRLSQGLNPEYVPANDWRFDRRREIEYVRGKKSIVFAGSQYIDMGDDDSLETDDWTVVGWGLLDENPATDYQTLFGLQIQMDTGDEYAGAYLRNELTGVIKGWVTTTTNSAKAFQGTIPTEEGVWYHYALRKNGTELKLFLNGLLAASDVATSTTMDWSTNGTKKTMIGGSWGTGALKYSWVGKIMSCAKYDDALSDADILSLAKGKDVTANLNARWSTDDPPYNLHHLAGGMSLDFTTAATMRATGAMSDLVPPVSFTCWIRPATVTGYDRVFITGDTGNGKGIAFALRDNGGEPYYLAFTLQGVADYLATDCHLTVNAWQLIGFSLDAWNGTVTVMHGIGDNVTTQQLSVGTQNSGGMYFNLGGNYNGTNAIDALMDDPRLYGNELSVAEFTALLQGTVPSYTPDDHWPLNDGPQRAEPGDGDIITSLTTKEGRRILFNQGDSASRPQFSLNTAAMNNRPALYFDGVDDCLEATLMALVGDRGVFHVALHFDVADQQYIYGQEGGSSGLGMSSGLKARAAISGSEITDTGTALALDTTYIITFIKNATTTRIRVNGEERTVSGTSAWWDALTTAVRTVLGAYASGSSSTLHFGGYGAEWLGYDRMLSEEEIEHNENYLMNRYI